MPKRASKTGSELFIVDNSDQDWKAQRYLKDWCEISKKLDIATGYFEIGALLSLGEDWQKIDKIRILMGDEVSRTTYKAFQEGLKTVEEKLDKSIEEEKERNEFLIGVPAIVAALRAKKIECKIFRDEKFHAKAYITHARIEVVGSAALVGSSNFTYPGLTDNIELNIQITGQQVNVLQEWYDEHWDKAEDVREDLLKIIERHVKEHSPFEVYAKSLHEFFKGYSVTDKEWEEKESKMYSVLDEYQKEAYHDLVLKSSKYNGAFLCDGVGLGKTYVGLMLIERYVKFEKKNVALFVPKSGRKAVWDRAIAKFLPDLSGGVYGGLAVFNHTDLLRQGDDFPKKMKSVSERADIVLIDEAHNFRNRGILGSDVNERKSRYWAMFDLLGNKKLFLLTATPVNNRLTDLQHMIELFSREEDGYFEDAPLGIHSLTGHFRKMEKALERLVDAGSHADTTDNLLPTDLAEAEAVLVKDDLFKALVVQRSRAYAIESQKRSGKTGAIFPERNDPQVAPYSLEKTYGQLLRDFEKAFSKKKPLLSLAIYSPLSYPRVAEAELDLMKKGRQEQVVVLIRTQLLKRFESSVKAFEQSCMQLLKKLLTWVQKHAETPMEKSNIEKFQGRNSALIEFIHRSDGILFDDEGEEDFISEEMLEAVEKIKRKECRVEDIINESMQDLEQLADFLKVLKNLPAKHDDKLNTITELLKSDPVLKDQKVLIFTEYQATAVYLEKELKNASISGIAELDGSKPDREDVIKQFSPYYNDSSSSRLKAEGLPEIRVLISTDVLAEGLNLQDATRLINYDIHWNPVRLMQRIGRIDRRLDEEKEKQIVNDHPEQKGIRGKIKYWNFLPPQELDRLLKLYSRVARKTLMISKTFGIEGKKLLRPDDNYEALREFNEQYVGELTREEKLHLEYKDLLETNPELRDKLDAMPKMIHSGKMRNEEASKTVFFCYSRPGKVIVEGAEVWSEDAGDTQWYLYDRENDSIVEDMPKVADIIRSEPDTSRVMNITASEFSDIRKKIEKHIKDTYLKKVDAPASVKARMNAWMEVS